MNLAEHVLAGVGILALAGIYGADLFALVVLRSALAHLDADALVATMGQVHRYGDRRLPAVFAVGAGAAVLGSITAALDGRVIAAALCLVAVMALAGWLTTFLMVSAPVNRALTSGAVDGLRVDDAPAQQRRWNRVLPLRWGLQLIALSALCVALASP